MQLKSSLWLNDRQPVKVLKSLNDRQSHILLKFIYMIGALDSLNSDCWSFSNFKNRDCPKKTKVSVSKPSVNQALDLRSIRLFWIAWELLIDMW